MINEGQLKDMLEVEDNVATIPGVVSSLRETFKSGRSKSLIYRQQQLDALARFMNECESEIKEALFQDLGRPPQEAYTGDIAVVTKEIAETRKYLSAWMAPKKVSTMFALQPASSHIQSEPLGVVLIISPWNYPIQLSLMPLIGAIAAGNCAILKPSEMAPATSKLLATMLPLYLGSDSVKVIEGAVPETTALLAEQFDHIFFTGSEPVGKIVMTAAAKHLTPVTLELGGKSPCIVDSDANISVAAERILWGKFSNAGQTCIAPDYVLVHKDVEEELLKCMKEKLHDFYGDEPEKSLDYGRIVNKNHHKRIMKLLPGSGDIFVGGQAKEDDRYIAPTILRNVPLDAPIMKKEAEIFGPILPVIKIDSIEDAVKFVNERPKPLAVYLFSENNNSKDYVEENTSSGSLVVNHTLIQASVATLPFGGVGASGMGAYHGKASFDTFSHQKSVLTKPTWRLDPAAYLLYPPYSETKEKWLKMV